MNKTMNLDIYFAIFQIDNYSDYYIYKYSIIYKYIFTIYFFICLFIKSIQNFFLKNRKIEKKNYNNVMLRYIAGNKLKNALKVSNHLKNYNKKPIINYAIESSINKNIIIKEFKDISNIIDNSYKVALKLSLFDFDTKLIKSVLNPFIEKNIPILIDAENNNNFIKYNKLTNNLMFHYNHDRVNIIKTYQMYRKDSLDILSNDISLFKTNKIKHGTKLVRGAYWNEDKNEGTLFLKKKETDMSYNLGIIELYNRKYSDYNLLATHNDESINLGYLLNNSIDFKSPIFEFGHLMGMKENKYENLVKNNQNVNVYIPYGPYRYMIPYLGRRLYENIDTIKYMFQ